MNTAALLQLRKKMRGKKPAFVLRESNFSARIERKWRFPQGRHSAIRQGYRGHQPLPTPGYGVPAAVRHLHPSGFSPKLVYSSADLNTIDPKTEGVIIGASVGKRKRAGIISLALERKITLLNIKNPQQVLEKIAAGLSVRKKEKEERNRKKQRQQEERKKKAEEKVKEKQKTGQEKKKEEIPAAAEAASLTSLAGESGRESLEQKELRELAEKTIIKKQ